MQESEMVRSAVDPVWTGCELTEKWIWILVLVIKMPSTKIEKGGGAGGGASGWNITPQSANFQKTCL